MVVAVGVDKRAGRRARVLEVAMLLARDGGYEAVQMRDVAAQAEVALGTLYRYYPSKNALLLDGLVGWCEYSRQRVRAIGVAGDSPAERLADALALIASWSDAQPRLMAALVTALGSTDPETAQYKSGIDVAVGGLLNDILGDDAPPDLPGVRRVIGHVWFSAIVRWVGGQAPSGSVGEELRSAVHLLLGRG